MFSQNFVDYDHKPRSEQFVAEQQSCSQLTCDARTSQNNQVITPIKRISAFPDFFVKEFICDQIIQTIGFNNEIKYFCFYCNYYIRDIKRVEEHLRTDQHIKMKGINRYNKGLNKKFVMKSINGKELEYLSEKEKEEMINQELDRIPNDQKHFYNRRGIRIMNVIGEFAYYCKICEKPISSLNLIQNHLDLGIHQKLENRLSLFQLIQEDRRQTPIVGLEFIIEYNNNSMNELVYKCSFCQFFANAEQMYCHLFEFKHQINVLNNLEAKNYDSISRNELIMRITEWHKKLGMGFVTTTKEMPNINGNTSNSSMEQLRAIFGSFRPKSCDLIQRLFAVRVDNESDAQKVSEIIEAIKEASIKYYSNKNKQNINHY